MFSYGKKIPKENARKENKINCFLKICVQYVQFLSRKEEAALMQGEDSLMSSVSSTLHFCN